MILTAVPGRTSVKIVLDADHPLIRTLARTNLAPNPSYQYGSVFPAVSGGGATLDLGTANGTQALRITPGSANNSAAYPLGSGGSAFTWQPGETYTFSAYCILNAAQTTTTPSTLARRITVGYNRPDGTQTFNDVLSSPASNVPGNTRLSVTFTIPTGVTGLNIRLMNGSNLPADVVYWDAILLERGTTLGSYFTGDSTSTARNLYEWTGAPGASTSTLTTLHSPLETGVSVSTVDVRFAYGNAQGPYSTSDTSRMAQLPYQVALITGTTLACDLFLGVEVHDEADMDKLLLTRIKAVDPDWALCRGDGGNSLYYRPSLYSAKAKPITYPVGRNMTDFTVTHLASGLVVHPIGTHWYADDDDDGTARDKEREAQAKYLAQYAAATPNAFLAGDFNFQSDTITALRGYLAAAGFVGLQTRVPAIANGSHDSSSSSTTSGRWIDDVFTRTDQAISNAAGIPAGNASDHYLWDRVTISFDTTAAPAPVRMTLFRDAGEGRVAVPGFSDVLATTGVATDHTAPLNRLVTYTADLDNGTTFTSVPVRITADLPLLSHPVSGVSVPVIIQDWPDRTMDNPGTLVKIPGRRSPIVLSDVEGMGTSAPVLLTCTRADELGVERLSETGDVLLLRTIYPELQDAFLAVTQRQVARVKQFKGTAPERLTTLSSQEIGPEDMLEAGQGDTLGNIAGTLAPGTLGDLAALFPGGTLLDIAVYDWRNVTAIVSPADPTDPTDPTGPTTPVVLAPVASFYGTPTTGTVTPATGGSTGSGGSTTTPPTPTGYGVSYGTAYGN